MSNTRHRKLNTCVEVDLFGGKMFIKEKIYKEQLTF